MYTRNIYAYVILICLFLTGCSSKDYQSGYDEGFANGQKVGYNEGLSASGLSTEDEIYNQGYQMGYEAGSDDGYKTGYDDGYIDGVKETGYTEEEYQRYAQDRVDAVFKELFAGQINPYTGAPVENEEDYRQYIIEHRHRLAE